MAEVRESCWCCKTPLRRRGEPRPSERVCDDCRREARAAPCKSGDECGGLGGFGQFASFCEPCHERLAAIDLGRPEPSPKPKPEAQPRQRFPLKVRAAELARLVRSADGPLLKRDAATAMGMAENGSLVRVVREAREQGWLAPSGQGERGYLPGDVKPPEPEGEAQAA